MCKQRMRREWLRSPPPPPPPPVPATGQRSTVAAHQKGTGVTNQYWYILVRDLTTMSSVAHRLLRCDMESATEVCRALNGLFMASCVSWSSFYVFVCILTFCVCFFSRCCRLLVLSEHLHDASSAVPVTVSISVLSITVRSLITDRW